MRFRREKQAVADFVKGEGGEYAVKMTLLEGEETLLSLTVNVPTHANAQRMADAWAKKAPEIYAAIMRGLGDGADSPAGP